MCFCTSLVHHLDIHTRGNFFLKLATKSRREHCETSCARLSDELHEAVRGVARGCQTLTTLFARKAIALLMKFELEQKHEEEIEMEKKKQRTTWMRSWWRDGRK